MHRMQPLYDFVTRDTNSFRIADRLRVAVVVRSASSSQQYFAVKNLYIKYTEKPYSEQPGTVPAIDHPALFDGIMITQVIVKIGEPIFTYTFVYCICILRM